MSTPHDAGWRPSTALTRAALLPAALAAVAVLFGRPDLLVLAAPFLLHAVAATVRRPRSVPQVSAHLAHTSLREGEGTTAVTRLHDVADAELAVVQLERGPWTVTQPPAATVAAAGDPDAEVLDVAVDLASTRWGRRSVGAGAVAAVGPWAGRVWGPVRVPSTTLTTLPVPGVFDSSGPVPHPIGLVGTHQSRRAGDGSELASIRPFAPGDRLRRIRWPVSLRTGTLHVTSTVAEEDSSVLLLLDGGVEVGRSEGVHGAASSLDTAVRAAGAVAEHYLRRGDRVGLRVLGSGTGRPVPFGGGRRHLRRLLDSLARIVPGDTREVDPARLRFQVPAGSVVVVLSPMLSDQAVVSTRLLAQRGLDVVVVDTLPQELGSADPLLALAWRMRRLEREALLLQVSRAGVPVVAWRGPGTLDDVLRGLARRGRTRVGAVR